MLTGSQGTRQPKPVERLLTVADKNLVSRLCVRGAKNSCTLARAYLSKSAQVFLGRDKIGWRVPASSVIYEIFRNIENPPQRRITSSPDGFQQLGELLCPQTISTWPAFKLPPMPEQMNDGVLQHHLGVVDPPQLTVNSPQRPAHPSRRRSLPMHALSREVARPTGHELRRTKTRQARV